MLQARLQAVGSVVHAMDARVLFAQICMYCMVLYYSLQCMKRIILLFLERYMAFFDRFTYFFHVHILFGILIQQKGIVE